MEKIISFWPQIILLSLMVYNICLNAFKHGRTKETKLYQFFLQIPSNAIHITLLYFGGFFNSFKAPQIIWLILFILGIILLVYKFGKFWHDNINIKEEKYNIFAILFSYVLILLIYYWGGFFDKFHL